MTPRFLNVSLKLFIVMFLLLMAGSSYSADIAKGGKLYAKHCATCHGVNGISIMPDAPNFARSERILRPDMFILTAIKEGKNAMPAYLGILKDPEILDVIAYMRTLEIGGPISP